jgi:hypothetical protein
MPEAGADVDLAIISFFNAVLEVAGAHRES